MSIAGNAPSRPAYPALLCVARRLAASRIRLIVVHPGRSRGGAGRRPPLSNHSSPPDVGLKTGKPKSCLWDSNPGPRPYQGRALPTEPRQQFDRSSQFNEKPVESLRINSVAGGLPRLPGTSPSADTNNNEDVHRIPARPGYADRGRAGDGNRTHVACLEGRYSTIELHPRFWPASGPAARNSHRRSPARSYPLKRADRTGGHHQSRSA